MPLTDSIVMILNEIVALGNGILRHWLDVPAEVRSPLDGNAALTESGHQLVAYLASAAMTASDIIATVAEGLF